jgi:hypothetical protein
MNKHHPHNNIIEKKLEQLPIADADQLWNDMNAILDKEMPQKKERRRFIWWFFGSNGFLLLSVSLIIISSSSIFFLSKKENSAFTINKSTDSQQSNKLIEDGDAKVLSESKENITTNNEMNQGTKNNISATANSTNTVDIVANNNFITGKPIKQLKKYTKKDQFNQPIETTSKTMETFDIAPPNLESIHQGLLVTTNLNEEKKSISPHLEPMANKLIKLNTPNNKESGFYAGIISGVDLSSIHFRSVKAGASKGFVIGYAFNKKWSIESGLLWDTKRVYDNGSYFNPPGYTPTNGIKIIAVNGKSRLYELPVNMKYTIISGKHNLFVTTGLSSYFMRSENYDYEYTQNNQPGGHNYLSYTNKTKDWFSVANFSVGYTHKLGNMGSMRIEPYLKLPIRNLGIGNMPIMSTGLNVGFIKKIR